MWHGYFWWCSGWMWIFPIIMIVVILVIVYLIFGRRNFNPPWRDSNRYSKEVKHSESESDLEILKKRYAKGEITKEEFDQIRKDIS